MLLYKALCLLIVKVKRPKCAMIVVGNAVMITNCCILLDT